MKPPGILLTETKAYLEEIRGLLVEDIEPTELSLDRQSELKIRSYCVLSHAALEEYFEGVALWLLDAVTDGFLVGERSKSLLTLVATCTKKMTIETDETVGEKKSFDYLRPIVAEAKEQLSHTIKENNGISVKYLRKLYIPLGIDVPPDPTLKNSLQLLARYRGDFAHGRIASKIPSVGDASSLIADCVEIAESVCRQAEVLSWRSSHITSL